MVTIDGIPCRANGPDNKGYQHARGGDEEQLSAANLVNEEAHADSDDEVEDLQAAVDQVLRECVGIAYILEDFEKIVRNKAVSGPTKC